MVRIRNVDICVSALLTLFGAYITYQGLDYGYLDASVPGPGFFPLWIGLALMVSSAANLVRVLRRADLLAGIETAEIVRVALSTVALAAFVWLGGVIGMIAAAFLLMLAIGFIFGPASTRFRIGLVAVSASMTAVLYCVFGIALAVPLL